MEYKENATAPFDAQAFLSQANGTRLILQYRNKQSIFRQGDLADSIFYLQTGKAKVSVVSKQGKEAVIAILVQGDFFGEGCLLGQLLRMASVTALTRCVITRLAKAEVARVLQQEPAFSALFITHLLSKKMRLEEDLVDHLFNTSEKRLARTLLLLADLGQEGKRAQVVPKISQQTLAEIVGTTRSRVNFFMNRFRKLGFIDYNGELEVHSSLQSVLFHD